MPPKAKKILITSETFERTVIKFSAGDPTFARCEACDEVTEVVSLEAASRVLKVGTRAILGLVDGGSLHEFETDEGLLAVCAKSIEQLGGDTRQALVGGREPG